MFSMAVAATRRRRIAAAAALGGRADPPRAPPRPPRLPGGAGLGVLSRPHRRLRRQPGGNAALNWAEGHARGCWYSYGGSSCSPGYDCSAW